MVVASRGVEMESEDKEKNRLARELAKLRRRVADLEAAEIERRQAEEELRSSHEYLRKLNDSLQEAILTVKVPEREIVYVNRSTKNIFGYQPEECIGRNTEFLYSNKEEYLGFGDKLKEAIREDREALNAECLMKRKGGEVFSAEITATFLEENGKIDQVISILRDITRRKQTQEAFRLSEARLAEAQRIAHLGNWDWNIAKDELVWSDEIYRIFGLTPRQFGATYEAFLDSVHPGDRELVEQSVNAALHDRGPYSIDHRIVLPDGAVRVVHEEAEVTCDKDGRAVRMMGTVHDVTERKRTEDALRALSNQLVQSQEDERRAIACELHDQIGQSLTALKLLLDRAARSPAEGAGAITDEARALVNDLMRRVRDLSLDLRPAMLDDLGLLQALLWHFDRYAAQTQIKIDFRQSGLERSFPVEIRTAAYRIIQEALTNVARHSGAKNVRVAAWADGARLCLSIEDDGRGFDPAEKAVAASVGLSGMKERARLLGGTFQVDASPGKGTSLAVELPLPHDST